jgi:hypothetical protein
MIFSPHHLRLQSIEVGFEACLVHLAGIKGFVKSSLECTGVNTKNWYRKETDMSAEFGRGVPFGRRFSSKHSVEASTVGSASSFGRRTVPRVKAESIRECVMMWI